jgi:PAS domain S-box-containing protein
MDALARFGGALDAVLAAIIEHAPDGIVLVDGDGRVMLSNPCLERQFGYPPGALLGRPVDLLVHEHARESHLAHRERFARAPRTRPMGSGQALTGRRADGTTIPVEVALSPVTVNGDAYTLAIVRDTSDRLEAAAALHRLQRLLDTSSEGVFLASAATGEVHYVNDGACQLTGLDRSALLRRRIAELLPGISDSVAAGEAAHEQITLIRAGGRPCACDILIQRFDWADGSWLAVFARDATARQRAEEQYFRAERAMAVLEEQERIARRLHDDVIQSLFGVATSLEGVASSTDDVKIVERLRRAVTGIDDAITRIRDAVFSTSDATTDVRAEVHVAIDDAAARLGFTPTLRFPDDAGPIPDAAQEALIAGLRLALDLVVERTGAANVIVDVELRDTAGFTVATDGGAGNWPDADDPRVRALSEAAAARGGTSRITEPAAGRHLLHWAIPTR